MHPILFIHSSLEGHPVASTIWLLWAVCCEHGMQYLPEALHPVLSDINITRSEIAALCGSPVFINFWETIILFLRIPHGFFVCVRKCQFLLSQHRVPQWMRIEFSGGTLSPGGKEGLFFQIHLFASLPGNPYSWTCLAPTYLSQISTHQGWNGEEPWLRGRGLFVSWRVMPAVHVKPNPLDPGAFGVQAEVSSETEGESSLSVEGKTHRTILFPHRACPAAEDSSLEQKASKRAQSHRYSTCRQGAAWHGGKAALGLEKPEFESFFLALTGHITSDVFLSFL